MILNHLLRRDPQPLVNANIRIPRRLQHLQEDQRLVARVLEVVRVGNGDVADVAGGEVEGAGGAWGLVDGEAGLALEEVGLGREG